MLREARARWGPSLVLGGVVIAACGFVIKLADSVRESESVVHLDDHVLRFVLGHRTGFLSGAARVVTQLGSGWVVAPLVAIVALLLLRSRRQGAALLVVCSSAGAAILVEIIKHVVARSRPPAVDQLVRAHGAAFPSGHSAQSVACYGALAWVAWSATESQRLRLLAVAGAGVVALLVGASRVYLGVHWLSDVVSGWLVGLGWLTALIGIASTRALQRDGEDLGSSTGGALGASFRRPKDRDQTGS